MPDNIDEVVDRESRLLDLSLQVTRENAALIPVGSPGECDLCGEWSGRLVDGECAPCRDKYAAARIREGRNG